MKQIKINKRFFKFFPIFGWSLMALWVLIFCVLLFWGVITSFKGPVNYWMDPIWFPDAQYEGWHYVNYGLAFQKMTVRISSGRYVQVPEMMFNTLYYCIVNSFLAQLGPLICSYIYAKYSKRVKWTKMIWGLALVNMYVPLSASLAASIRLAKMIGYYNNLFFYSIIFLSGTNSSFLIYYALWKGLSWEYAEAAIIDGASPFTIFLKIMLPMIATVFWVLFLSAVIGHWTEYTTPMIYLSDYPTLAYAVFKFQQSYEPGASEVPVKLAALFVVAMPMLVLFLIFREKMMGSLTMGGLKG